jgi:hypothetical protein
MAAPRAQAPDQFVIQVSGDAAAGSSAEKPAAAANTPVALSALPTASSVLVGGKATSFEAYNIEGNNYFKLRDIAKVMDTGTTWDGATSTIGYRHRSCL